jgi:adenylate/nucleoside-diphosphate kinase
VEELIKPRMEEERKKMVEQVRKDATESAIQTVKAKLKEQLEAEHAAREEGR